MGDDEDKKPNGSGGGGSSASGSPVVSAGSTPSFFGVDAQRNFFALPTINEAGSSNNWSSSSSDGSSTGSSNSSSPKTTTPTQTSSYTVEGAGETGQGIYGRGTAPLEKGKCTYWRGRGSSRSSFGGTRSGGNSNSDQPGGDPDLSPENDDKARMMEVFFSSNPIKTNPINAAKGVTNALKFGGDEAVIHFGKHADQIMKVTGKSAYNLKNYVDDANWIIQNGTYSSKLNGYYSFMANGSKGQSLFGFVGMKNGGSTISTFHIKSAAQLGLK